VVLALLPSPHEFDDAPNCVAEFDAGSADNVAAVDDDDALGAPAIIIALS